MVLDSPLRILHVLRAPLGGLFRHVCDLAREQSERGHLVGVMADSSRANPQAEAAFEALGAVCKLGIFRVPMSRQLGLNDRKAVRYVAMRALECKAEILHGHGAKGGAYVRLARTQALRVYTPHGGSLHYSRLSPLGLLYLRLEKMLARKTDLFLFESEFSLNAFGKKIGEPRALARVVHNGVTPEELHPLMPHGDAADVIFVGELRKLKGVGDLIDALSRSPRSAILFGGGPDAEKFRADVAKRGLAAQIEFAGSLPAREAFKRGRVLVVPSHAESFPYIVLEAAAASVPMIATNVGGIPEIYGPDADTLIPPRNPATLAEAIAVSLKEPPDALTARLRARVAASFTVAAMTDGVLRAYRDALSARQHRNR
jgi:glycosyltransferase involved in cell wall biosynthesis